MCKQPLVAATVAIVALVSAAYMPRALAQDGSASSRAIEAGSSPTSREGIRLHVAIGDEPAVGVIVEFAELPAEAKRMFPVADKPPSLLGSVDPAFRKTITCLTTDSDGNVTLPVFSRRAEIRGRLGNAVARRTLSPADAPSTVLVLKPGIPVLVVDSAGAPRAGVPVATDSNPEPGRFDRDRTVTDAEGLAILVPPWPPQKTRADRDEPAVRWKVGIDLPLQMSVDIGIGTAKPRQSPIRLILPALGRVGIRLVRPDGNSFDEPARVWIKSAIQWPTTDDMTNLGWGDSFVSAVNGLAGPIETGLGGRLTVIVRPLDRSLRDVAVVVEAPHAAGELVEAVAVLGARAVMVTGRLIGSVDIGIGVTLFSARLKDEQESESRAERGTFSRDNFTSALCSKDGRFWLRFNVDAATRLPSKIEIECLVRPRKSVGPTIADLTDPDRFFYRDLPDAFVTSEVDLGDVVIPDAIQRRVKASSRPK